MEAEKLRKEIWRRLSIVKNELIGNAPEDLQRHYRLMGMREALN